MEVPAETPITIPDADPIVATDGFVLTHVPPADASVSMEILPVHALEEPVIGSTRLITLNASVDVQPDGTV